MIYRNIKNLNQLNNSKPNSKSKTKPKIEYEYRYKNKSLVTNKSILNYIEESKSKLPPPSYSGVVINPNRKAKYISTSFDGTKRKQYQYSLYYENYRQKQKYCHLITLGKHLSKHKRRL